MNSYVVDMAEKLEIDFAPDKICIDSTACWRLLSTLWNKPISKAKQ